MGENLYDPFEYRGAILDEAKSAPTMIPLWSTRDNGAFSTLIQIYASGTILKFIDHAEKGSSGLNFAWMYYPDDDHGSVPLITEYDAFRFLFPWYRREDLNKFLNQFLKGLELGDSPFTKEKLSRLEPE